MSSDGYTAQADRILPPWVFNTLALPGLSNVIRWKSEVAASLNSLLPAEVPGRVVTLTAEGDDAYVLFSNDDLLTVQNAPGNHIDGLRGVDIGGHLYAGIPRPFTVQPNMTRFIRRSVTADITIEMLFE